MAQDLNTHAIILGGGRGSRLYPLTKLRAKPAVPLAGKYRLIDIMMSNCINSGITKISILTQFLSMSLQNHIYKTYNFNAFSKGFVELLPAEQTLTDSDWYQGSADAVRRRLSAFSSRHANDALILAGDHLYRMDYAKFVEFHRSRKADVTIGVLPVTPEDAARFGILKKNDRDRIVDFREKPKNETELAGMDSYEGEKPYLASMGIYIFTMDALKKLLHDVPGDDFGKHIVPAAIEHMDVYAYPFHGYWEDIGTISAFYNSSLSLTGPNPPFDLYDFHNPIFTRSRFLPPSRIDESEMNNVIAADGCRLNKAKISSSIIGLRGIVKEGSVLKDVIMMGADYYENENWNEEERNNTSIPALGIGKNCRIERAIIDKNVRIGDNVTITSQKDAKDVETDLYSIRDGIVVIPKDTIIPAGTEI